MATVALGAKYFDLPMSFTRSMMLGGRNHIKTPVGGSLLRRTGLHRIFLLIALERLKCPKFKSVLPRLERPVQIAENRL